MSKEQRKHPRFSTNGNLQIRTALTTTTYTVPVKNASKGGAFIYTVKLPIPSESIYFEILDEYGLPLATGHGEIVRIVDTRDASRSGFAIRFNNELEQTMLDFLCAVRMEETV